MVAEAYGVATSLNYMPVRRLSHLRVSRIYGWVLNEMRRRVEADLTLEELAQLIYTLYQLPDSVLDHIRMAFAVIQAQ